MAETEEDQPIEEQTVKKQEDEPRDEKNASVKPRFIIEANKEKSGKASTKWDEKYVMDEDDFIVSDMDEEAPRKKNSKKKHKNEKGGRKKKEHKNMDDLKWKTAKAPKKPKPEVDPTAPRMLKTSNRLMGEIQDDIYCFDEVENDGRVRFQDDEEDLKGQEMDFGPPEEKPVKKSTFLEKMAKKRQQEDDNEVTHGIIQRIWKQISNNELAASGINLPYREKLIEFIKEQDEQTKEQKNLLASLQKEGETVEKDMQIVENSTSQHEIAHLHPPE